MITSNAVAWYWNTGNTPATGYIFAWGIFASGIAQYVLLAVACRRAGMPLFPTMPRLTPDVKRVVTLSVPGIVSGGVTQINLMIGTMIATTVDRGVSYLYYADRLYQLPLGVIVVAIGVVLLPDLSRRLRSGDGDGAMRSQNRALEMSLFLTIPAAIALMAIPVPILETVFEHGAFRYEDTLNVAPAVLAYAAGLPAYSIIKVFQPGFYAREDTATPMRFAIISVVVNIGLSFGLSRVMGHVGIALAASISAWLNALQLGMALTRRGHFEADERLRFRLPRIVLSGLVMGALLLGGAWLLRSSYGRETAFWGHLWSLLLLVAGGGLAYFTLAHATGAMRLHELRSMLKRPAKPARTGP
jgi:putative peptidoglycan lipid II flippase